VGSDLRSGLETLSVVEKSINESSQEPLQQGGDTGGTQTAYEISKMEQNSNTILGLFLQMIARHVKDFGNLRKGDILQYMTLPEVAEITGDALLTYKTFFLKGSSKGNGKNKKIVFTGELPDEMTDEEYLDASYDIKNEQEGKDMEIAKVNPSIFRELDYMITISPDVMSPRSEDLERAYSLELFDRMIKSPVANQEEALKLLVSTDPTAKKDADKYIMKQPSPEMMPGNPTAAPAGGPLAQMQKKPASMGAPNTLAGVAR
jgi:hypothetical protein